MRKAVCSIVSKNYLAAARVLMDGVARNEPDADRIVLLVDRVDGAFDPHRENFRLLLSTALPIPDSSWFHFKYTILELNTAVKPFLMERLLQEGYDAVVYLDPDIQVHSPLDEVWRALRSSNAVLTPHLDQPVEDGKFPGEIDILRTGAYNLGFIGLRRSPQTVEFVRWWGRRLERYCVVNLSSGLFVDQKWMDLLPGMLEPVEVVRHPGYNVAYWNIHGRLVEKTGGSFTVNGQPLCFFHFSGFHPRRPERFSKHQNRFELADLPEGVRTLCAGYANSLLAAGFDETAKWPYAYGSFQDGKPIVDIGRRVWWEMPELVREIADPFGVEGGKRIREVWNEMIPDPAGRWSGFSRLGWWLFESWPEARVLMPDPFGADRLRVLHWLVDSIRLEWSVPEEYFTPIRASISILSRFPGQELPEELLQRLSGDPSWHLPGAARTIHSSRSDLKQTFPDPAGKDRAAYIQWLLTFGRLEHRLPPQVISTLKREWHAALSDMPATRSLPLRARFAAMKAATAWRGRQQLAAQKRAAGGARPQALRRTPLPSAGPLAGINLVGYARAEMGVGESVRAAARAARAAGLEVALCGVEAHPKYRATDLSAGSFADSLPFPVTVLCVNADQTGAIMSQIRSRLDATRYRIGVWAWELEQFPERWMGAFDLLDEVWAPSDFCRTAIAAVSPKPVLRIPHAIELLPDAAVSRESLGMPRSSLTVLYVFDAMSVMARKNPLAAVQAFRQAFGPDDDVSLILKVSHSSAAPEAMAQLRQACAGTKATIIDRVMDRVEVASLIRHADIVLSLHRSEGFGLTLAEAMSAGKLVICTGYSGNMDFTMPGSALPTNYSLVPVGEGNEPYDESALWAEPDIEHAAALLRQAHLDPAMRLRIGEEAERRIRRDLSPQAVGLMMRRRLEALHRRLRD